MSAVPQHRHLSIRAINCRGLRRDDLRLAADDLGQRSGSMSVIAIFHQLSKVREDATTGWNSFRLARRTLRRLQTRVLPNAVATPFNRYWPRCIRAVRSGALETSISPP
jgi:hypothetical protein